MVFKLLGVILVLLGVYLLLLGVNQPQLSNTGMNLGVGAIMTILGGLLFVYKRK